MSIIPKNPVVFLFRFGNVAGQATKRLRLRNVQSQVLIFSLTCGVNRLSVRFSVAGRPIFGDLQRNRTSPATVQASTCGTLTPSCFLLQPFFIDSQFRALTSASLRHVDVCKAYNGDFASTRQGAAASHNQARRPSPTGNVKVANFFSIIPDSCYLCARNAVFLGYRNRCPIPIER